MAISVVRVRHLGEEDLLHDRRVERGAQSAVDRITDRSDACMNGQKDVKRIDRESGVRGKAVCI